MDAKESSIYIAVLITAIVIGSVMFYFFISIIRQQRRSRLLHKKNVLAEIAQIEKERSRIAADLHDEIGPLLAAVRIKINCVEVPDKEDKKQVLKAKQYIDNILQRIREISFDLMPKSLLRKGVVAALREFINSLNNSTDIRFHFDAPRELKLDEQKSINIYRITQEVVHNTIKHSKASSLSIRITLEKDNVIIKMKDDGIGFDYANESDENVGFGLRNLLRRTEVMGGKMFLDSKPGKGTTYTFQIPES